MKWLLLRGLSREQRHWGQFRKDFNVAFGAENVFCLDHVGIGTEKGRPVVYSIEGMALDLRQRWLELKGSDSSPWGILSLSMGSMISLRWCESFAQDFKYQIIMNVSSSTESRPWTRLRLDNVPKFVELAKVHDQKMRERKVLDICSNLVSSEEKDRLAMEWAEFALPKSEIRKVVISQICAATRYRRPKKMTVPTLALVSAADRLVDPSCTMKLASALNIPFEIHPNAGHELPLDDPEWVISHVKNFVK